MARFLIEVPHESGTAACAHAAWILLNTGSHYLTHADFGCKDGDHRAWIVVEADTREEARGTLPQAYRASARITGLNKFSLDELEELMGHHRDGPVADG